MRHAVPRVAVESTGPHDGGAYLLLHGTPGSRQQFRWLCEHAPSRARIVLVDLLDHGEAPDELLATHAPLEDDLVAIVDAIDAPLTVVGSSYGGWLAARLATRRPDRVRRVVTIAGFAMLEPADLEVRRGAHALLSVGGPALEAMMATWSASLFGEHAQTEPARLALETILRHTTPARLDRLLQRLLRFDDKSLAVGKTAVPLVALHGRGDQVVPVAHAAPLAHCSQHGSVVELDTASHLLHVTHSDEVARVVFGG